MVYSIFGTQDFSSLDTHISADDVIRPGDIISFNRENTMCEKRQTPNGMTFNWVYSINFVIREDYDEYRLNVPFRAVMKGARGSLATLLKKCTTQMDFLDCIINKSIKCVGTEMKEINECVCREIPLFDLV